MNTKWSIKFYAMGTTELKCYLLFWEQVARRAILQVFPSRVPKWIEDWILKSKKKSPFMYSFFLFI